MTKYIFVTGGVVSGLGKGMISASIANILKSANHSVFIQKIDPYLNVDPGTMSPWEHGEVFVTDDGSETDLDLGHYERFSNTDLTGESSITSGKINKFLIENERKGKFLGQTVQLIPHFTNEVKRRILKYKDKFDFQIIEIGGTVGDIEMGPFLESIRQIKTTLPRKQTINIHVVYIPFLNNTKEYKTKPTQHSLSSLRSYGINADVIITRSNDELEQKIIEKISRFSEIPINNIFQSYDVDNIIKIPLLLQEQKIYQVLSELLDFDKKRVNLSPTKKIYKESVAPKQKVNIAIIGKYLSLEDSYISLIESLKYSCWKNNRYLNLITLNSDELNSRNVKSKIKNIDGFVIPGGFSKRGMEGKILVIKYCRENNIPILGICVGFQLMCIEYFRNVLKYKNANSTEFDPETTHPIIKLLGKNEKFIAGDQRLGGDYVDLKDGSYIKKIYGKSKIRERHRHRYTLNLEYESKLNDKDVSITGYSKVIPEVIEIKKLNFFIGVQYHPEFITKVVNPNPLFVEFIRKSINNSVKLK